MIIAVGRKGKKMSDKIELKFDPLGRGKILSQAEALKSLYKFYSDLLEAGFSNNDALNLIVKILLEKGK